MVDTGQPIRRDKKLHSVKQAQLFCIVTAAAIGLSRAGRNLLHGAFVLVLGWQVKVPVGGAWRREQVGGLPVFNMYHRTER